MDLEKLKVSHFNLDEFSLDKSYSDKDKVFWKIVEVKSFTIRDLLHGLSKEQLETEKVFINEVPEHSKSILNKMQKITQDKESETNKEKTNKEISLM